MTAPRDSHTASPNVKGSMLKPKLKKNIAPKKSRNGTNIFLAVYLSVVSGLVLGDSTSAGKALLSILIAFGYMMLFFIIARKLPKWLNRIFDISNPVGDHGSDRDKQECGADFKYEMIQGESLSLLGKKIPRQFLEGLQAADA